MAKLWAHQEAVLVHLVVGNWLLLWEPGVGKTAVLIVAGGIVGGRQLWITLAVLIPQTLAEIRRWRPAATVQHVRTGRDRVRPDADIVIVSYDLMRRPPIWRQLYALTWDSAVADEGHALGHSSSIRTRAFYGARADSPGALHRKCERVWIATGTPVLNSPDELHPHLSRLFPRLIPDLLRKADFLDRFCITATRPFGTVIVGARNLPELREVLAGCASQLRLRDTTDLPPLLSDIVHIEITPEHRAALDAALTPEQRQELHIVLTQIKGGDEAAWQRLNAMLPALASVRRVLALAKAQAAVDLVTTELSGGTDRIVLFGLHQAAMRYVVDKCRNHGVVTLTGDTPSHLRDGLIKQFTSGGARLLVASVRVAGFGLNLQAARRCIFLETDWTPAGFDQAVARLYRAGQTRPVHASLLAVANSIDTRVAEVIRRKRTIIKELTGGLA